MGRTPEPLLALALAFAGCGSARPKRTDGPAPVAVVAPQEDEAEAEDPGVVETSERHADPESLASCAARLRAEPFAQGAAGDEYRAAYAFEMQGDLSNARVAYYRIIQNSPTSPYVPLVYLAFAELFANEATSDPSKRDLARQAYREVLKYPPPGNPAYAYAWLRLGEVDRAQGDFQTALADYVKVGQAVHAYPNTPCASELEQATRSGVVQAYAQAGAPDKAWTFFVRQAGDQADAWTADLADEYLRLGKKQEACAALQAASSKSAVLERSRKRACP